MLVLDTSVMRNPTVIGQLRGRHPTSRLSIPAVAVMELLRQVIRGDTSARAALGPVALGEVSVLPEFEERLRTCFGLPARLPSEHSDVWRGLARLAAQDQLSPGQLTREWNLLAERGDVGWSVDQFEALKSDPAFHLDMRALFARNRQSSREVAARYHNGLTSQTSQWVLSLASHYIMYSTGLIRCWILNQLAAAGGVESAAARLVAKATGESPFAIYNECVEPCYRGGLETLVALVEARALPWLRENGKQPEGNDLWDIAILASVGDGPDDVLVTAEDDWVAAAQRAERAGKVVRPEVLLRGPPTPKGEPPTTGGVAAPDAIDWFAEARDPRVRHLRPRAFTAAVLERTLRETRADAAAAYGAAAEGWWPTLGQAGQGQATTWAWATVLRLANDLPALVKGKMTLAANRGKEHHFNARKTLLDSLWTAHGHKHSRYEVLVDFNIAAYHSPGNPTVMTAESEMFAWHGAGPMMGGRNRRHQRRIDDYTWDFYKLLLVPSPFRLLMARVGAADGDSETGRLAELRESLGSVMEWYGRDLLGGAELAAILLPETPSLDFAGVHLGVWGEAGWAWTQPKAHLEGGTPPASRPTGAQEKRGAST
jgi:hypothetical protein